MPTLDDLNAVFDELESRAPETITLAGVRAADPRRARTGLVLLSAAAVVALTVGVAVMAPRFGAHPVAAASGGTIAPVAAATPTTAGRIPTTHPQTPSSTAVVPATDKVAGSKAAPSPADSSVVSQAPGTVSEPRSVRVPFRITGVGDLTLRQAEFDGTDGGVVVEVAGTVWDFGWSMAALHASDKPATDTVNFAGREWVVQYDGTTSAIVSVWATAPGFGMTITPVGKDLTLDEYKAFLGHVSLPQDLDSPGTWPTAADLN